jgi:hypothetical protein
MSDDRPSPSLPLTLVICALILAPTLAYPFGLDQGTFAYMAAGLLEGRLPYIGTWDHQMPGGVVLHAIEIALLGKSIVMFRAADLVYQLLNIALIYGIARRIADRAAALLAAGTFALIYQGYGPWNTGQREGFALLFVLLAFYLYLTRDRRADARTALGIGLCFGIAATIKLVFLAFPAMYAPLLIGTRDEGGTSNKGEGTWSAGGTDVRLVAIAGAGAVAPLAVVVLFYWWQGAFRAFYEAAVAYQTQVYVHRLRGTDPVLFYWWSKFTRLGVRTIVLPLAYLPLLALPDRRLERTMVWLGFLVSAAVVFVQGTFAGYHFLPGLGFGAILIGDLVSQVIARLLPRVRPAVLVLAVLIVAAPVYIKAQAVRDLVSLRFLAPPEPGALRIASVFDFTEAHDVAAYLESHTAPGDPIQVWGHESLVYYLANRHAASRFQTSNGLVMRVPGQPITPMQKAWRREFMASLERQPPRYIVITRGDHWWWAPDERTSEELVSDFPEFEAFVKQRYTLETEIGRYAVYRAT